MPCCIECIQTAEVGIVERCGKYYRQAGPGANCVCYPVDEIVGVVNMRVQQLDVEIETKTLDNVFVMVVVSIQYSPIQERLWEAFYSLESHKLQIRAYIEDVVRAVLPTQSLDDAFESKEAIALSIKRRLDATMHTYGYLILNSLVTDMTPDYRVRNAMNEINASKRLKEAAAEKAEGDKVRPAASYALPPDGVDAPDANRRRAGPERQVRRGRGRVEVPRGRRRRAAAQGHRRRPQELHQRLHVERADQGRLVEGRRRLAADYAVLRHVKQHRHAAGHADGLHRRGRRVRRE